MAVHSAGKHNLPRQSTSFIGREREIGQLSARLDNPACQLLTLTGPGGIGKTRLAVELAARKLAAFGDGICFVPLQSLQLASQIISAIFGALFVPMGADPHQQLLDYFSARHVLLVLDNFEHLPEGTGLVSGLLAAAPALKVLVTSRHVLNLREEWVCPVGGMDIPDAALNGSIGDFDAVRLFAERAVQAGPDFALEPDHDHVLRICQLVEGMPLALELAAGWTRTLSCAVIASEIQQGIEFLHTNLVNVPERHRSMRAALNHSWQLLDADDQAVFRRLAIFRGGFTHEAAQAVAGASLMILTRLVDQSLVKLNAKGRYDLHELLRQFAEEHLEASGEMEAIREAHSRYYLDLLPETHFQVFHIGVGHCQIEIDNIRVAIDWAIHNGQVERACRRAFALTELYGGYTTTHEEGRAAFARMAEAAQMTLPEMQGHLRMGQMLIHQAWMLISMGDHEHARQLNRQGMALLGEHDFDPEIAGTYEYGATLCAMLDGDIETARQVCEDLIAWYQSAGLDWGVASFGSWYGTLLYYDFGQKEDGLRWTEEALAVFRRYNARAGMMTSLMHLCQILLTTDDFARTMACTAEGQKLAQELRHPWYECCFTLYLGQVVCKQGDYAAARQHYLQIYPSFLEMGELVFIHEALASIVEWLMQVGHDAQAVAFTVLLTHAPGANLPSNQVRAKKIKAQLAARMPAAAFAAAWKRGQSLTLADVEREFAAVTPFLNLRHDSDALTARELEVLQLLTNGLSNAQIAERLFLTVGTVKGHLHQIYAKLGVDNRVQALTKAREQHLI